MSTTKPALLAGLAVLALSALAASTASAGEWDVNGKPLVERKALASPIKVLEHGVLEAGGVRIECISSELGVSGGEIVAPDEIRVKDITFKGCSVSPPCSLASSTLLSLPAHGLAELDGTLGTYIKILPLPSKTFLAIKLEGESCALVGIQPITGTFDMLLPSGRDPSVLQLTNIASLPGSLKAGSAEAKLSARGDAQLESKETWNFL